MAVPEHVTCPSSIMCYAMVLAWLGGGPGWMFLPMLVCQLSLVAIELACTYERAREMVPVASE